MLAETLERLHRKLVYLESGQTTLLRGVRLIDGTGGPPREGTTLVIEGDRVVRVEADGEARATNASARLFDCQGCTVIPGLFDCHIHLTGDTVVDPVERHSPNVWGGYRGVVAVWDVARALEAGMTTVRELGHGNPEQVYGLRRAVAEGLIPGPRILTSGWAISQTGGHGDPHFLPHEITLKYRPRSAFADGADACRRLVRQNFAEGADCIKIYTSEGTLFGGDGRNRKFANFTLEEIRAMTDEAHRRGAKVAAHATIAEGVRNAILGGVDTIEHGGPLGGTPELLELMAERGTFLVPTLKIYEVIATQSARFGVESSSQESARRRLEGQQVYLQTALARGVKIATGTDTSLFDRGDNARELGLLVESGFTPMQAIVAGTRTSAEALGLDCHLGTLEPGKVAELLVLEHDPLADIHSLRNKENIRWIFKSRDQLA